jgi:hypothetical protein
MPGEHRYSSRPAHVAVLATCLLLTQGSRANALPVPAESLRTVIVTIDGIREFEFMQWNDRLLAWIDSTGAFIPNCVNATRGITEPNHAILWGCGDPGHCLNTEGHPALPMHFELLRRQRGLPMSSAAIVTGKRHLAEANAYSDHPDSAGPTRRQR